MPPRHEIHAADGDAMTRPLRVAFGSLAPAVGCSRGACRRCPRPPRSSAAARPSATRGARHQQREANACRPGEEAGGCGLGEEGTDAHQDRARQDHRQARRHAQWQAGGTALIDPGKPWQNGATESFNGRLRDECLSLERFCSRAEAKAVIEGQAKEEPRAELSSKSWPEERGQVEQARQAHRRHQPEDAGADTAPDAARRSDKLHRPSGAAAQVGIPAHRARLHAQRRLLRCLDWDRSEFGEGGRSSSRLRQAGECKMTLLANTHVYRPEAGGW